MLKVFYEPTDHIVGAYSEKDAAWSMTGQHYHNTYEFYLLTDGDRDVIIGGKRNKIRKHDLVIIKPYTLHYMERGNSDTFSRWVINLSREDTYRFLDKKEVSFIFDNVPSCIIHLDDNQFERVWEFCARIKSFTYRRTPFAGKLAVFYVIAFMEYINEILSRAEIVFSTEKGVLRSDMIEAVTYIHGRISDASLKLDDVVEHIHMSKSRFCEVFKETTGLTFLHYINYIRVITIEKELWTTKKSMSFLAEENGFPSADHMARVFKEIYHIPPSEYRKQKSEYLKDK